MCPIQEAVPYRETNLRHFFPHNVYRNSVIVNEITGSIRCATGMFTGGKPSAKGSMWTHSTGVHPVEDLKLRGVCFPPQQGYNKHCMWSIDNIFCSDTDKTFIWKKRIFGIKNHCSFQSPPCVLNYCVIHVLHISASVNNVVLTGGSIRAEGPGMCLY